MTLLSQVVLTKGWLLEVTSLILATIAIVVSGVALGWQVLSWRMPGGRVRVDLDHERLTRRQVKAGIRRYVGIVRNVGRLPITVETVELFSSNGLLASPAFVRLTPLPSV